MVSQGISTESWISWQSLLDFENLMDVSWNNWRLCLISPKLCLLLWILPALHPRLNRAKGLTMDCWYYLDLSFLLECCLYSVSFPALLIWKQIQHSLSSSVSKSIHILKPVLNSCFPWISLLLFCNVHSLWFSCEVKTSLFLLYWLLLSMF